MKAEEIRYLRQRILRYIFLNLFGEEFHRTKLGNLKHDDIADAIINVSLECCKVWEGKELLMGND